MARAAVPTRSTEPTGGGLRSRRLGLAACALVSVLGGGCDTAGPGSHPPKSGAAASPESLLERARAARRAGDTQGAEAAYTELLGRAPQHPGASLEVGDWFVELDRLMEAEALLRHATILAPDDGAAHAALGEVLFKKGEAADACTSLERAVSLQKDPRYSTWIALARSAALLGDRPRRAAEAYGFASACQVASAPRIAADDLVEAARQFQLAGDVTAVRATLHAALVLQPDHQQAKAELARLP